MKPIADVVPVAMAQITGEPVATPVHDVDVAFLRVCARQVRTQDVRVSKRLEGIAERLERAVTAGQLLPVRETL